MVFLTVKDDKNPSGRVDEDTIVSSILERVLKVATEQVMDSVHKKLDEFIASKVEYINKLNLDIQDALKSLQVDVSAWAVNRQEVQEVKEEALQAIKNNSEDNLNTKNSIEGIKKELLEKIEIINKLCENVKEVSVVITEYVNKPRTNTLGAINVTDHPKEQGELPVGAIYYDPTSDTFNLKKTNNTLSI